MLNRKFAVCPDPRGLLRNMGMNSAVPKSLQFAPPADRWHCTVWPTRQSFDEKKTKETQRSGAAFGLVVGRNPYCLGVALIFFFLTDKFNI